MVAKAVTFAVQMGSGGFDVARNVAERLHYRYYDWEVVASAAAEAGVPPESIEAAQKYQSAFRRIVERLLTAGAYVPDEVAPVGPNAAVMASAIRALNSTDYRKLVERIVSELGSTGEAVIVGHAGQVVLKDDPAVLRVFITGSPARRAERVAEEAGVSREQAATMVKQSDDERQGFFRETYKIGLRDAAAYSISLNTDHLSMDACIDLILKAVSELPGFVKERMPADAVSAG